MNKMLAKIALRVLIEPAAHVSWLCAHHLGAFSRAYGAAQLDVIYGPTDGSESTSLPWLARNVRRVIESASVDTGSGCRMHGEAPHRWH